MDLTTYLNSWKSDPSIGPNISSWQIIPERSPLFEGFPDNLDPKLKQHLNKLGIEALYYHQYQAWMNILNGSNIALVTGTASGKTLAYNLPVLQELLKNSSKRALFIYPTKALAHDQLAVLDAFSAVTANTYDGDTPQNKRSAVRNQSQIIITNPDMVHIGILPYHTNWEKFFSNLSYIIIDEMHSYRGVFGSHVANVIRRLKRITSHYGSTPQYILTSATIGNPQDHAESIINEPVLLIDEDTSSRGKKHFLIYNPPIINEAFGLRASMQRECIRLASDLISRDFQTIIFGRSRRSVEFMLLNLREKTSTEPNAVRSYRSGYLPQERREIESGLRSGIVRAVTATNALELGIDIGGLDASILAGYPGSIAGTWQQAGRSGRTDSASLSVLVASANPLDQYLAHHPDFIYSSNPESALIDPDNLLILFAHLSCAAFEIPFSENDQFGNLSVSQTNELLKILKNNALLHFSNGKYFWMNDIYPASDISLRSASSKKIILQEKYTGKKIKTVGVVDYESAYWMVHPGAIYLHDGDTYMIEELNLEENTATLQLISPDYYTEPERKTSFSVDEILFADQFPGAEKSLGEITITSQVTGFKKINWVQYEVLSHETLDMPPISFSTSGFWLSLSTELETILSNEGLWTSGPNLYGPDWESIRLKVLETDKYTCQICGKSCSNDTLHIHHKKPLRSYTSLHEANKLENLISLCPRCHQRAETVVKVNSGIRGLGYVLHSLSPLLLMCDPSDLGFHTDYQSPFGNGRPIVLIYENVPGGIGYSNTLYTHAEELLARSYSLVNSCPCLDGCPSCVGPGGELGSGGKKQALALLKILTS